jgi:hypothetical protein
MPRMESFLYLLVAIFALAIFWQSTMAAREAANVAAVEACAERGHHGELALLEPTSGDSRIRCVIAPQTSAAERLPASVRMRSMSCMGAARQALVDGVVPIRTLSPGAGNAA